jgi:hypothetical protein
MTVTMHPTARMAAILGRLAATPGRAVSSAELRVLVPDYGGDRGNRLYRRDLRELRERNFVRTDISSTETPRRTGVQLRVRGKAPELHLSRREHAALVRARARLRPGPVGVEVRTGRGRQLDVALAVVRYLEEGIGEASVSWLASHLGVSAVELRDALWALEEHAYPDQLGFPDIVVDADEDELGEDEDWTVRLSGVPRLFAVLAAEEHGGSPTEHRGLDHFGRFAYTAAETAERLELILVALDDDRTSDNDRAALANAMDKLEQWYRELRGRAWRPSLLMT